MSLRLRLALAMGVLSGIAIVVFAAGAFLFAVDDLAQAADDELLLRLDEVLALDSGTAPVDGPIADGFAVIDDRGDLVTDSALIPVTDDERAIATGSMPGPILWDADVDGRSFRLISGARDDGGAVRLSLEITQVIEGLRSLQRRLIIGGLLGGLVVALAGWWFAGRFVAPVVAVTDAAETLALRQDLPSRLKVQRSDEVGRLASSFNSLLDALAVAREQQQRLVADASHELRTPLTSLRTKVEFLQAAPELPPAKRADVVDGAVEELERLTDLVSELVDLAADVGSGDELPVEVDVAAVVTAEADRFGRASGRTVDVDIDDVAATVDGRPRAIARALSNLLRNADKFSPRGEPVAVRVRGSSIEVIDRGPGIPADERSRVFDRFYRGTGSHGTDGSGIGLAIVARVAELHGGEVWVGDDPGGGAVVGFSVAETFS